MKLGTWVVVGFGAVLVMPLVVVLVIVASQARSEEDNPTTASTSLETRDLPDFVYTSSNSAAAYRLALAQGDLLAQMPCFCGCANLSDDPHQNLLDCFVNEDGSLDPHASGCTICTDIALDVARWRAEGAATAEIRSRVDDKYSGYGPATDTPPVSE